MLVLFFNVPLIYSNIRTVKTQFILYRASFLAVRIYFDYMDLKKQTDMIAYINSKKKHTIYDLVSWQKPFLHNFCEKK